MSTDTEALRQQLRNRDGDNCSLCGEPMDFALPPRHIRAVTIDHIVPKAAGGGGLQRNLRLAHYTCNNSKGAVYEGTDYALIRNREGLKRKAPVPPRRPRRVTHLQQSVGDAFWSAYLRAAEKAGRERTASDERYMRWVEEGRRLLAAETSDTPPVTEGNREHHEPERADQAAA